MEVIDSSRVEFSITMQVVNSALNCVSYHSQAGLKSP